ncbi:lipopolysaccharide heptosyltransferase II [Psychromonas sp.]|uniref:lipopolysaccharide heptosyltransferase II n=1 Tax=Psychromonas sp. TaxID=1884585 RepID=UPI00356467D4
MKILIISPSWVGDMVMTQSLYITLKEQNPDCIIDVLAPQWCLPILEKMPQINKAIEMPLGHGDFNLKARYQLGKSLQNEHYDTAYILPNSAKSSLIPFFAKIPKRIGWKGEMRYGLINDLRNNKKSFQYMLERYVSLAYPKDKMTGSGCLGDIHSLPKPKLEINEQIRSNILEKFNLSLEPKIIGLCPGAEFGPAKRWPEEHYGEIAKNLIKQGYQVWLFGSAKDRVTTDKIAALVGNTEQDMISNLAGNTTLNEAVDLLSCCHTVVSNDSGLMHVAAAVGCNIVGIYGSSSPLYTPPLTEHVEIVHTDIECRPCFKKECPYQHLKCLNDLKPDVVMKRIQNFLEKKEK